MIDERAERRGKACERPHPKTSLMLMSSLCIHLSIAILASKLSGSLALNILDDRIHIREDLTRTKGQMHSPPLHRIFLNEKQTPQADAAKANQPYFIMDDHDVKRDQSTEDNNNAVKCDCSDGKSTGSNCWHICHTVRRTRKSEQFGRNRERAKHLTLIFGSDAISNAHRIVPIQSAALTSIFQRKASPSVEQSLNNAYETRKYSQATIHLHGMGRDSRILKESNVKNIRQNLGETVNIRRAGESMELNYRNADRKRGRRAKRQTVATEMPASHNEANYLTKASAKNRSSAAKNVKNIKSLDATFDSTEGESEIVASALHANPRTQLPASEFLFCRKNGWQKKLSCKLLLNQFEFSF